jgi:hypothetical protein
VKKFTAKSGFGRAPDDDLLIEAQAPIEGGGFRPVIFRRSRIDYLFGFNDEISGLTLDDGVTIPVAMPLAKLKQKVFQPDEDTDSGLDLMAVTGDVVNKVERIRLSRQFNPAAEMQEAKEEKPLDIVAHVHAQKADRQFKRVRFSEKIISFYEPHVDRPEKEIWVQLRDGHTAGGFICRCRCQTFCGIWIAQGKRGAPRWIYLKRRGQRPRRNLNWIDRA